MFDFTDFVNYCDSFYGTNGIHKMNATKLQLSLAVTDIFFDEDFQADSTDREKVRKILEEKFSLKEVN